MNRVRVHCAVNAAAVLAERSSRSLKRIGSILRCVFSVLARPELSGYFSVLLEPRGGSSQESDTTSALVVLPRRFVCTRERPCSLARGLPSLSGGLRRQDMSRFVRWRRGRGKRSDERDADCDSGDQRERKPTRFSTSLAYVLMQVNKATTGSGSMPSTFEVALQRHYNSPQHQPSSLRAEDALLCHRRDAQHPHSWECSHNISITFPTQLRREFLSSSRAPCMRICTATCSADQSVPSAWPRTEDAVEAPSTQDPAEPRLRPYSCCSTCVTGLLWCAPAYELQSPGAEAARQWLDVIGHAHSVL